MNTNSFRVCVSSSKMHDNRTITFFPWKQANDVNYFTEGKCSIIYTQQKKVKEITENHGIKVHQKKQIFNFHLFV